MTDQLALVFKVTDNPERKQRFRIGKSYSHSLQSTPACKAIDKGGGLKPPKMFRVQHHGLVNRTILKHSNFLFYNAIITASPSPPT